MSKYFTPEERIEAVKAFATKHYTEGGWDIVVETYSDEDIQVAYGLARTPEGAIRNVAKKVGAAASYRDDIIASGDDLPAIDFDKVTMVDGVTGEVIVGPDPEQDMEGYMATSVKCPKCKAEPGMVCVTPAGNTSTVIHAARTVKALKG